MYLLQKLAKTTSQYYFVLRSLHKTRSRNYKACTNYFQVLLCTTKLAQSTSQYHFVLQSLQKLLPSTTMYYKACTKHFPVLLCTTKLAQTKHVPILLCTTKLTQRRRKLQLQNRISTPKRQKDDFEALLKGILKGKLLAPKLRKSADNSLSQPWCSHTNTIYDLQLQKTIVLRMQPQHWATLTHPLQCDLQRLSWKTQKNCPQRCRKLQLQNRISTPKRQKDDFEALFKRNFKRKIISAKIEKICWQFTFAALMQPFQYDLRSSAAKDNSITHAAVAPSNLDAATTMRFAASRGKPTPIYARGNTKWQQSCSHSNAICNHSSKNRIELRTQEQPLVAKHIGGTIRAWNDPSRTRRTDEVPFFAGCSHFTRKNTRFRAPASSPKHSPCNIHAAIPMRSATTASRTA